MGADTSTGTEIADRIIWDSFISKWHVWDLLRVGGGLTTTVGGLGRETKKGGLL